MAVKKKTYVDVKNIVVRAKNNYTTTGSARSRIAKNGCFSLLLIRQQIKRRKTGNIIIIISHERPSSFVMITEYQVRLLAELPTSLLLTYL
jgi:hypothetical protein